jgi:prepilin-type N-terminal cleavage/methylation domain-containing protein
MSRRFERGFTLIEVLAALLIAGGALTYLISSQADSISRAARTRAVREATLLAAEKMEEIVLGTETAASGTFDECEGVSWEAASEPFGRYGCTRITLTVTCTEGGNTHRIVLERVVE